MTPPRARRSRSSSTGKPVGPQDVRIDIEYCGVCHCDVHQARGEIAGPLATNVPRMPGHEMAGIVAEVGGEVGT